MEISLKSAVVCFHKGVFCDNAGLLDVMLHKVLSISSVKLLCRHNAISHTLRSELMCGMFQLYIWWLILQQTLSFNSLLQNKLVLTLTEDIIIQPETEKQEKSQILEKKFQNLAHFELNFSNASDFKTNFSQRVRFWIKNFPTPQMLNLKLYNASDLGENYIIKKQVFEKNMFLKSTILVRNLILENRLWKKWHTENHDLIQFFPQNVQILPFTWIFQKHDFGDYIFSRKHGFECKKFSKRHDFELKILIRVRFWSEENTTSQILL